MLLFPYFCVLSSLFSCPLIRYPIFFNIYFVSNLVPDPEVAERGDLFSQKGGQVCKLVNEAQGYKCHSKDMHRVPWGHSGERGEIHFEESRKASHRSPLCYNLKDEKLIFSSDSGCALQHQDIVYDCWGRSRWWQNKKLQNNQPYRMEI